MHMLSNKDLSSDEMDTLRRSRTPTTVVTANGEVQTNEEATSVRFRPRSVRHSDYSMKRQQFYRLGSFAQNTDVHMRRKAAKLHD